MNRMHIPKLLAVVCMAALGASSLNAQRADTDVQAKAREKLREAMAQADAQQVTAPAQPAVTKPPAAPPPVIVSAPAAPVQTAPGNSNADAEEKAREQLRQAAAQLEAQQPQPPSRPPITHIPPVAPEKPKPVVKVKAVKPAKVAATQPAPEPKKKPTVSKPIAVIPAPRLMTPAMAPAPGSKEQRLDDLLQLYKTDKITPTEYHERRARILSGP